MNIKVKFNFVQGHSLTHYDRQSDIVDYRAAYFAAKKFIFTSIVKLYIEKVLLNVK